MMSDFPAGDGQIIEVSRFSVRTPAERVRDYLLVLANLAEVPPRACDIAAALSLPLDTVQLALDDLAQCAMVERRYTLRRDAL